MRAIVVDAPGGIEVLEVRDMPDPSWGNDDVLIDVAYAGCNWADTQVRTGEYPHSIDYPTIPGFEVSGTVTAVGANVSDIGVGDRVAAIPSTGGYAEKCAAPAALVTRLPESISPDTGAAFQIQALTAYHMLHTIHRIGEGDSVLIHAAGGGVGGFVVQLAVKAGARVFGTVGTPGKERKPLGYGAEAVLNLSEGDFVSAVQDLTNGEGVDLAIDSLGAETLDRTFGAVRNLGHVINIGEAEGVPYRNIRERILPRSQTFTRFHLGHIMERPDLWKRGLDYVLQAISDGWLDVPIVDRIPLEKVRDMHAQFEGRHVSGKLLLSISG